MKRTIAASAALMVLLTGPGLATPITRQVDFSFSGVVQVSGGPAVPPPVSPVIGSFTITFDPTLAYTDQSIGLVLNSLNLTLGSTAGFTYFQPQDILVFGGLAGAGGAQGIVSNTFDVSVRIDHFQTAPIIGSAGYSQGGPTYAAGASVTGTNVIGNLSSTLTVKDPTAQIPEPVTLSLFSAGLIGAAILRRRRKQT